MSPLNGKWKLADSQNMEAYLVAIKATPEFMEQVKALAAEAETNPDIYQEEIKVDKAAGTAQRIVYIKGQVIKDSGVFKFGEAQEGKAYGKMVKMTVTLDGDNKMTCKEVGTDFTSICVVEVKGDEITATSTGEGVTAVEKYVRV